MNHPNECAICHRQKNYITTSLGICVECIREQDTSEFYIKRAHEKSREKHNLPLWIPKSMKGVSCNICSNNCIIAHGDYGYCGFRTNIDGQIKSLVDTESALLYFYKDPHITNCCASWFCPAGTGCGYPKFAKKNGPEYGYDNLAVFFYGCNFNCLFCQNVSHKNLDLTNKIKKEDFKREVEVDKITCICFFGGSPEPQLPFALSVSREIIESDSSRLLRICFEFNGCGNKSLVREAAELAVVTGGNLKFDLKCFDENVSKALCGVSNRRTFDNFEMVAKDFFSKNLAVPNLTATTLLVPGYIDEKEVGAIAQFIGSLNSEIPYSLLVFHPDFEMVDLPTTPAKQVHSCFSAARKYLKNVHIANMHLLS